MRKTTIQIGISAHNEERNIKNVLSDILAQTIPASMEITKIVVVSDGSSDRTVNTAQELDSSLIQIINGTQRKGKAIRLNELFDRFDADVVIIFDADIRLHDKHTIARLAAPISRATADLTSARIEELPTHSWIGHVLRVSMEMKKKIFEQHNSGNNIYTCHGRARAFSKRFYSKFTIHYSPSEDAYSYIACLEQGLTYQYVHNAHVYYTLPESFLDHQKQSVRFIHSQSMFTHTLNPKVIRDMYRLPKSISLRIFFQTLIAHPFDVIAYCCITLIMKLYAIPHTTNVAVWDAVGSTK